MEDTCKDIDFSIGAKQYDFLNQIQRKLGSSFVRESLNKKAIESHGQFNEALQEYFKYHLITSATLDVLDSSQCSTTAAAQDNHGSSIHLKTIEKYIPEITTPFHPDQIQKLLERKKKSQAKLTEHTKLVEDKINEFCKALNNYTGQSDFCMGNWKKTFQESVKDMLLKAQVLDYANIAPQNKKGLLQDMLQAYYQELLEGADMLKELSQLYEEKFKLQLNTSQMCIEKSLCLLMNIRLTEKQFLNKTYHAEALAALRMIDDDLKSKKEQLVEEKVGKLTTLQAYEVLGPDYEKLVESYAELSERVERQQWAIDALKSRMGD